MDAIRIHSYDASWAAGQKYGFAELLIKVPGVFLHISQRKNITQLDIDVVQPGCFQIICLAVDVFELVAIVSGIEQNYFVRKLFKQGVGLVYERLVCDGSWDLLVYYQSICILQGGGDAVQQSPVGCLGSFVEKAEVNSGLFAALKVWLAKGYGIEILLLNNQIRCIDAQSVELAC